MGLYATFLERIVIHIVLLGFLQRVPLCVDTLDNGGADGFIAIISDLRFH